MIAGYSVRLTVLCFASFFLFHLVFGLLSLRLYAWLRLVFRSMRPQRVARISLLLRLAPASLSVLMVIAVCAPSYLQYERNGSSEEIGLLSLVLACLGFFICLIAITRAAHAILQSALLTRKLRTVQVSESWHLNKEIEDFPFMGLIGLFKSRVLVSPHVLDTLTPEQFQVALDHERAHRTARDNLKRLLIVLSPDLFPFARSFRAIEDLWEKSAELSADDLATRGQPRRSIALAEALVKLARLEASTPPPLVSSLFTAEDGLALRVDRLLHPIQGSKTASSSNGFIWSGLLFLLVGVGFALPQLHIFHSVYPLLESMLR